MSSFAAYLIAHQATIELSAAFLGTALVSTMPDPDKKWLCVQTLKEWLYAFSHQISNSKNSKAISPKE